MIANIALKWLLVNFQVILLLNMTLNDSEYFIVLRCVFVIYVACLSYCLVCKLQPSGNLLETGWPLDSLVCDVFLCFCHFPIYCSGSGVVHDCIDS